MLFIIHPPLTYPIVWCHQQNETYKSLHRTCFRWVELNNKIEFYLNDTAYIKFGNTDVDTITFSLEKYDTKCCKNQTDITGVRYNNAFQLMPNKGVLEIMK